MALQPEGETETVTIPSPSKNKSQVYVQGRAGWKGLKQEKAKEKRKREELGAEMIALEEEDHKDL